MRFLRGRASSLVAVALFAAATGAAQTLEEFEELEELYAWGAVSSVVEVDEDGDSQVTGFFLHTDEGETFEIVMDDLGRALAKESSDRTDVVVEVEGRLSINSLMVTVTEFRIVYVDPNDEDLAPDQE